MVKRKDHPSDGLFQALEAPTRFELVNKGFADLCLTSWLWRHLMAEAILAYSSWFVKGFSLHFYFMPAGAGYDTGKRKKLRLHRKTVKIADSKKRKPSFSLPEFAAQAALSVPTANQVERRIARNSKRSTGVLCKKMPQTGGSDREPSRGRFGPSRRAECTLLRKRRNKGAGGWFLYAKGKKSRSKVNFAPAWSGLRGSNSLPPPWQGGALPDELNPQNWCLRPESNQRHEDFQSSALPTELQRQMAIRMGFEPTTSSVTG